MPATVADPNRSLDSEQISPATIAHHTVYEKTPNLHQSHICQWGAQPYLVGPLSRLVGKPPLSPWVSADFLPLTQVVNNTNSTIPLTEIFDRVFSDVCNSLGFEVQKQKKRGSGNNRVYRNLNDTLARSLELVVTECKEHTIHTQMQVVASRNNGGFFPDIILKFSGTHGDRGILFSLFSRPRAGLATLSG